jgi:hypothetical protein
MLTRPANATVPALMLLPPNQDILNHRQPCDLVDARGTHAQSITVTPVTVSPTSGANRGTD